MKLRLGSGTPLATCRHWLFAAMAALLLVLCAACGGSSHPFHNAYISLPSADTIGLFHIDNSSGALTSVSNSVPLAHTGPKGLALHPSGKFLFAANSTGNSVSIFNVGGDGSLSQNGNPTPAGVSPFGMVIDPSGAFLLVTNNISNTMSVFSIDSGSGALTLTNTVSAGPGPTEILMTPSGKYVYVLNPAANNTIQGFTYSSGTLQPMQGSPFAAGRGTTGIAVDPGENFIYTANSQDNTVSGFSIGSGGALTPVVGSPFTSTAGTTPSTLAVDTTGKFLYVATPGSSSSIWVFSITPPGGQDAGVLTPVTNSPFSFAAGSSFLIMEPRGMFFYIGGTAASIAGDSYDPNTAAPTAITGSPFPTGSVPGKLLITQ